MIFIMKEMTSLVARNMYGFLFVFLSTIIEHERNPFTGFFISKYNGNIRTVTINLACGDVEARSFFLKS